MTSPRWTIALGACACAAGGAYAFAVDPADGAYPLCVFHALTGYYCAGCGATRALHALLHGRVLEAAHDNVLFVLLLPMALVLAGRTTFSAWRDDRWPTATLNPRPLLKRAAALVMIAALFMTVRNIPGTRFDLLRPLG